MNLIIFDFQHFVPPFIVDIAEEAKKQGISVWFVSAKISNYNGEYQRMRACANIIQLSGRRVVVDLLKNAPFLWKKEFISEIAHSMREHTITRDFLITYIKNGLVSNALNLEAKRIERKNRIHIVLATWFHVEAFAAAMVKERNRAIASVSLAHSFEVNPQRNRYVSYMQNAFRHKYIDKTMFISEKVFRLYKGKVKEELSIRDLNSTVHYLGSRNPTMSMNPSRDSDQQAYIIITCSNCVQLKRLDLLMDCFENHLLKKNIRWIHIGDGSTYSELCFRADRINTEHGEEKVRFLGRYSNEQVLELYRSQHIDLFVNISSIEGLPISIMEAFSFGIPAVATDVGGTSEILTDECGYLIPSNLTAENLSHYINRFFELSESTVERMRKNAFDRWLHYFNAEQNIKELVEEIKKLAATTNTMEENHENSSY